MNVFLNWKVKSMEEFIQKITNNKQIIGIGSGKTVHSIIQYLPDKNIDYVAASLEMEGYLRERYLNVVEFGAFDHIDVYIDGADFFDQKKNLLKGGGGCILKERCCMGLSSQNHIIVQKYKEKSDFSGCRVALEVIEPCINFFKRYCIEKKIASSLRKDFSESGLFRTEEGNVIFDVDFKDFRTHQLEEIPGIVCHGYLEFSKTNYNLFIMDNDQ